MARARFWTRESLSLLSHQIMAIAVEPLGFVCAVAIFVGISVVVQLSYWAGAAGQSQLLGPMLVAVVVRELAPLLVNLIVIIRSGGAMTTELGVLKINQDSRTIDTETNDSFRDLVVPRILALAVSTFCLTIVFIFAAFASGFLFAAWTGQGSRDLSLFADSVSRSVQPREVFIILAKSILPALFAGAACCIGGLGVHGSVTEIPNATQRALTRCVAGLFVISATVTALTYL
jgi:phospholipid/cholesterol/gamma-HCH transport system permease protein